MRLVEPTKALRATVTAAVAGVVIKPEVLATGVRRRVTILVPASPQVSMAIDVAVRDVAGGRNYTMIDLPPGQVVRLWLLADQALLLLATTGQAEAGLIVEYWMEDGQ